MDRFSLIIYFYSPYCTIRIPNSIVSPKKPRDIVLLLFSLPKININELKNNNPNRKKRVDEKNLIKSCVFQKIGFGHKKKEFRESTLNAVPFQILLAHFLTSSHSFQLNRGGPRCCCTVVCSWSKPVLIGPPSVG
jgi:hypothetical protein